MRYNYYRCEKCKAIIPVKRIKEKGNCSKCGGRRLFVAHFMGYNMPRPWEWVLILLGVR